MFLFPRTITLLILFLSIGSLSGWSAPSRFGLGRRPEQQRIDAFNERRAVLTDLLGTDPFELSGLTEDDVTDLRTRWVNPSNASDANRKFKILGSRTGESPSNALSWLPQHTTNNTSAYRTSSTNVYTEYKSKIESNAADGLQAFLRHLQEAYAPQDSTRPLVVDLLRFQLEGSRHELKIDLLEILFTVQVNSSWIQSLKHRFLRGSVASGSVVALIEAFLYADQHYYLIQHGIGSAIAGGTLAAFTYYGNRKARAYSRQKEETRRLLSYLMADGYGSYLDGLFYLRITDQGPIYSAQALIAHQMSTHCGRNLK